MDPLTVAALIGAAGSAIGGIGSLFGGSKKSNTEQVPLYNQQQQGALDQILKMGLGDLTNPGQAVNNPFAMNARKQFNERSIPSLIERLGARGSNGFLSAAGTSGFGRALGSTAGDFESALASLQHQQAFQLLNTGLSPQTHPVYEPGGQSGWQNFTQGSAPSFLAILPYLLQLFQSQGGQQKDFGFSSDFNQSAEKFGSMFKNGGQ